MRDAAVPVPEGWENAGMLLDQPLSPWRLSVALMTDEANAVKQLLSHAVSVSMLMRLRPTHQIDARKPPAPSLLTT